MSWIHELMERLDMRDVYRNWIQEMKTEAGYWSLVKVLDT
jgi:hypothetical protein